MFYEHQPEEMQQSYKKMLEIVGSLTLLFSENTAPYLPYRIHENVFCKSFEADNLGRTDCSADAKKSRYGIGLKTWVGNDDQKIAEFGRLRPQYENLTGLELVTQISEYRNDRIRITINMHDIDEMIYHIVKREPGKMKILEHAFDYIEINNIVLLENRGNSNNIYFTDGKHTYHFSLSKNTLYMLFSDMEELDSILVMIMADPYEYLAQLHEGITETALLPTTPPTTEIITPFRMATATDLDIRSRQLCLRLYSTDRTTGEKFVGQNSGLNQWNGYRSVRKTNPDGHSYLHRTRRNPNELYIPYPAVDRERNPDYFPPRDTPFSLRLPDDTVISAKVCQAAYTKLSEERYRSLSDAEKLIEDKRRVTGKAIMSNPNRVLGEWLLRKVFELEEGTEVTYLMLERFGIDCVVFTKIGENEYSVDFAEIGTYEEFYSDIPEDGLEQE